MANYCTVNLKITCANETEAIKLQTKLSELQRQADAENDAMWIGNSRRYLSDTYLAREDEVVILEGYVKWCLEHEEALATVFFLCNEAVIRHISIFYHEPGCLVLGQYEYENEMLTDYYVPESLYPEYDEETAEYPILEEAISQHAIADYVGEITAKKAG